MKKYTVVVPIKTKNNEDVLKKIKEILRKMGKNIKIICIDNKCVIAGKDFKNYMENKGITLYKTRGYFILPSVLNIPTKIYFSKKLK